MTQQPLSIDTENLFELVCHEQTLAKAFDLVKKNQGSHGVDGVSLADFETNKTEELATLTKELVNWRYKPQPVRRVEIPKTGNSGVRLLGVAFIRDRVVQTAIKLVLEPLIDPSFSNSSFGFRPGRNQKQAIESARQLVEDGKEFVMDIDLSNFFDRINHDKIIAKLKRFVDDKRILRLIGMTLRSGVMTYECYEPTTSGATQGSPLSPLLSNLILDGLDKKLEQRGLEFVRYADDCNIFVKSRKAANRVMESISQYIEKKMKLVVNEEKSKLALSRQVKFLGVTIVKGTVAISKAAISNAKTKVKELIPRGTHKTLEDSAKDFNRWYKGWSNYFEVTYYPAQFATIEAYARRRFRARIVSQSKRRRFLFKKLKKRGIKAKTAAKVAFSNKKRWALSRSKAVELAFPNKYFQEVGLLIKSQEQHQHWFEMSRWIHLT